MKKYLVLGLLCITGLRLMAQIHKPILVEAESFQDRGGWQLDTQFIELMGSPYLIAHGLGKPVADAKTEIDLPETGKYRLWVRTKDWVAIWNAPGMPGRFQVLINNEPVKETFGTKSAHWLWQDGGTVDILNKKTTLALHDLTGFEGRCDAIILTKDLHFEPANDSSPTASWRRSYQNKPDRPQEMGRYDVVVVGGGYAGTASAIAAARLGCKVALIQNRPVLGGNGSSEIRVWAQGLIKRGLYPRLGEIVEEFMDKATKSPGKYEEFGDAKKEALVRNEKNISLFFDHHAFKVEMENGRIKAVVAMDTSTSDWKRFAGDLFVDCTGHGTLAALANADHVVKETDHMGMSNMWRWRVADTPRNFPDIPWAIKLKLSDFPYPNRYAGEWFWESGFKKHPLNDLEEIRDWNLRAVYSAFNVMKNGDGKEKHLNAELEWVAYIGGNRESRQVLGDVILTRDDIVSKKAFPDGCVPTTWDIDLHYADEKFTAAVADNPFISRAVFDKAVDRNQGYPVPYRCFYSRNVGNLFMAGRCISVTHEALGTVRVMKTGGMIGEVVGKAAAVCIKNNCLPRDVYEKYLAELQELMRLPGATRKDIVQNRSNPVP